MGRMNHCDQPINATHFNFLTNPCGEHITYISIKICIFTCPNSTSHYLKPNFHPTYCLLAMIKPLVDLLWDDAIKRHDTFWCSFPFGHNLTSDVWFQVFGWLVAGSSSKADFGSSEGSKLWRTGPKNWPPDKPDPAL